MLLFGRFGAVAEAAPSTASRAFERVVLIVLENTGESTKSLLPSPSTLCREMVYLENEPNLLKGVKHCTPS